MDGSQAISANRVAALSILIRVTEGEGEGVGVTEGEGEGVGVTVGEGEGVGVTEGESIGVTVGVGVGVTESVGAPSQPTTNRQIANDKINVRICIRSSLPSPNHYKQTKQSAR